MNFNGKTATDIRSGNNLKVGYNAVTNGAMIGIGQLDKFLPGPTGATFNLILTPFNTALGYGAGRINPQNQRK